MSSSTPCLPPITMHSCLARYDSFNEISKRWRWGIGEQRHLQLPWCLLDVAAGGLALSPRTSRGQKESSSPNVCLSQTRKICTKVTKTLAKCSTNIKSRPVSCLLRSLPTLSPQDRAPCQKSHARVPQSPGEGSHVVPAATASARHPPWGLRPGDRKTRATRQKKRHLEPIRALQPTANTNCTQDRSQFLLQL